MDNIKQWILNREFVKEYVLSFIKTGEENEALYRKAFNDARKDLEETQIFNVDKKAKELSDKKLNEMLSIVDMNHVISIDKKNGILYLGKERATDIELINLKAEADFIVNSHIWKLLHETPKELAHRTMFVSSESLDDLKKGKSMLYTLDSQQSVINTLRGYTPKR